MTIRRLVLGIALLLALQAVAAIRALADDEVSLFKSEDESCDIKVTASKESRTITIRIAPHAGATQACAMSQKDTLGLIYLAFAAIAGKPSVKEGGPFRSIALGRLIDYEWFSRHLSESAERDSGWSAAEGMPANGDRPERYVHQAMAQRVLLDPIDAELKNYGYRAAGFSCEKALISSPDTQSSQPAWVTAGKRLPFDALCHLVLKPLS